MFRRNVMFNMPYEMEKDGPAVMHFNKDTTVSVEDFQHRIQVDDRIAVRFINNFDFENTGVVAGGGNEFGVPFTVDREGNVSLPFIGRVKVLGLTKQEASKLLQERYSEDFVNPNVEVNVLNLSVSVLGEVTRPGSYPLTREKTTLLEVLSQAGGVTPYGKLYQVRVVRGAAQGEEEDPEIIVYDLTQLEVIREEELILRDKDIIYVEPKGIRIFSQNVVPYTAILSIGSTVGTIAVVILNLTRN